MNIFATEVALKATNGQLDRSSKEFKNIVFGLEVILVEATKFITYGIVFACLGKTFEYIFAMLVLCPLRQFMGGYHAKTYWGCFFITLSIFVAAIYLPLFLSINIYFNIGTIMIGLFLIFFVVPVDTINIPIKDLTIRKKYKLKSFIIFIIYGSISIYLHYISSYYAGIASIMMMFTLVLLPAGLFKNKIELKNLRRKVIL